MTAFLRACSDPLPAALFDGSIIGEADLVTLTLVGGTVFRWTSWDRDLDFDGHTWASKSPWVECTGWEVTNTAAVPTLNLTLRDTNAGFNGGPSLKTQINQGLLDGAELLLTQAYLVRGEDAFGTLVVLDAIDLFAGDVGAIDYDGATIEMAVKGKVNRLDQYAPRNLYITSCNHAFCDAGCTLDRATFIASYTMGSSPTRTHIPWASAPSNPARYQGGTLSISTGPDSGARRNIAKADSSGLTLVYPLSAAPVTGNAFTAFEGCDKSFDSGSVQSCTARSNTQHYRGFEFVPPPTTAI